MVYQEGSYYIDHPPDTVFEYLNKPKNASEVSPTLKRSEKVEKAENGGWVVRAEYKVAGGIAEGDVILQPVVFEKDNRIKYVLDDDISGYVDWEFDSHNEGTMFRHESEYTVEIPVPDMFMKTVGKHITKKELKSIISNLRENVDEYAAD